MKKIFENNRAWVKNHLANDPEFFVNLAKGQKPEYLFIGCSDSRAPANEITGTGPGEVFVHRNVANMVVHTDLNMLSVMQYAVEVLKVKHILVCGHYGCGGVQAALSTQQFGLIDNWIRNIKDVIRLHENELDQIKDEEKRWRRLVELNVIEQAYNVTQTTIFKNAAESDNPVQVHGLVWDMGEGLLKELDIETLQFKNLEEVYGIKEFMNEHISHNH